MTLNYELFTAGNSHTTTTFKWCPLLKDLLGMLLLFAYVMADAPRASFLARRCRLRIEEFL